MSFVGYVTTEVRWRVYRGNIFGYHNDTPRGKRSIWVVFQDNAPPLRQHMVAIGMLRVRVNGQPRRIQRICLQDSSIRLYPDSADVGVDDTVDILIADLHTPTPKQIVDLRGASLSAEEHSRLTKKYIEREKERRRQGVRALPSCAHSSKICASE